MPQYLLTLAYLGSAYCGFQVQPNGVSIQKTVQDALDSLYGVRPDVRGCSRTDAGVHAKDFKLTFQMQPDLPDVPDIPAQKLPAALNRYLPEDISVLSCRVVPDTFHVRYDVLKKTYEYRIFPSHVRDPFISGRAWQYPGSPDLERMQRAADRFCGEHDFSAFMASGSAVEDTVRTVYSADVIREGREVVFRVCADGFLYHMVRIMAGTLCEVSEGKIDPEDIPEILASKDRKNAGRTAPAEGLYLLSVEYGEID